MATINPSSSPFDEPPQPKGDMVTSGSPGLVIARAVGVTIANSALAHPLDNAITRHVAGIKDAGLPPSSHHEKLQHWYKGVGVAAMGRFFNNLSLFFLTPPIYKAAKTVMSEEAAKDTALVGAGYAQATLNYPLSKIQTMLLMDPNTKGGWDIFNKTVKNHGARHLIDPDVAFLQGTRSAISMLALVQILENSQKSDQDKNSLKGLFKAVCTGAAVQIPIGFGVMPLNIIGTKLQTGHIEAMRDSTKVAPTPLSVTKEIYKNGGFRSFFNIPPFLSAARSAAAGAATAGVLKLIPIVNDYIDRFKKQPPKSTPPSTGIKGELDRGNSHQFNAFNFA